MCDVIVYNVMFCHLRVMFVRWSAEMAVSCRLLPTWIMHIVIDDIAINMQALPLAQCQWQVSQWQVSQTQCHSHSVTVSVTVTVSQCHSQCHKQCHTHSYSDSGSVTVSDSKSVRQLVGSHGHGHAHAMAWPWAWHWQFTLTMTGPLPLSL